MSTSVHPLNRDTSEAIRVARVLCILSMISVHFWPGATIVLHADVPGPIHAFYLVVIDYLGRGSVPLLSTVSGVLLTLSAARKDVPLTLLGSKARTFLLPMIVWSAVMLGLALTYAAVRGDVSELPVGPMGWVNALFALTAPPANVPLAFLRDVFVAAALGLLAIGIHRRSPVVAVLLLVAATLAETLTGGIVLLRPQILTFFSLGIFMSWGGVANFVPRWWLVLAMLTASIVTLHVLPPVDGPLGEFLRAYLNRIAMMLLMWRCAIAIVRDGGRAHRAIRQLEPLVFTIFCSHMVMVAFVAVLGKSLHLQVEDPVYPLVFVAQFPLAVLLAMAIVATRRRMRPQVPTS